MGERLFRFLWSKAIYFKNSDEINEFREIMMDFVREYKLSMKLLYPIVGKAVVVYYDANCRKIDSKHLIEWEYSAVPWNEAKKQCNLKNDKEEKDMLKILEIYGNKQMKEIEQKYDKQLKDIEENDPISVYLKQTEEAIKEMLNSDNVSLVLNSDTMEFTQETVDKKRKIIDTIRTEKAKIKAQIEEITALLELAPNYEEKLQILRDYGIIDKKKNIVL
jgi:hypothetical protein